jgi:hypothetical protein
LPDGRQLTAPFTHIHIPDAYGASASQGGKLRPSVTVEPAHPFLYGDCLSFVYVHICLDLEFLGDPGIKGSGCKPGDLQDVIDKTVKAFEDGVQKLLSNIVCKCSTLGVHDTFGPGCRRRVRIVWHTDCKPKKGDGKTPGPTPMPLEIRCFRKKDAPFGLTTPDTKYEVESAHNRSDAWAPIVEEIYAHEVGHNLFGIPVSDAPKGDWDEVGHNKGDETGGWTEPLMSGKPRTGEGAKLSQKEACQLVTLTGGCDIPACCRPIFAMAAIQLVRVVGQPLEVGGLAPPSVLASAGVASTALLQSVVA